MRTVDRIFGWMMVVAALLQCFGAIHNDWHWDRNVSLLAVGTESSQLLLGALNLVRAERRHDLVLARLCVFGNLLWIAIIVAYIAIHHAHYLFTLSNLAIVLGLLLLSMRSRKRSRPM